MLWIVCSTSLASLTIRVAVVAIAAIFLLFTLLDPTVLLNMVCLMVSEVLVGLALGILAVVSLLLKVPIVCLSSNAHGCTIAFLSILSLQFLVL